MEPPPPSYDEAITTQPGKYGFGQPSEVILFPPQQAPRILSELEKRYNRVGDRLIFDFEKVTCCPGQPSGLEEQAKFYVPTELAEIGVTGQIWNEWMKELDEVQRKSPTICGCMTMFCFPGGLVQSILCAMFCPISGNHPLKCLPCFYGDWYEGLRQWMEKVNRVLNRHDMHAKFLTYKPFNTAPRSKNYSTRITGKDHNYEMSFLAIATTQSESVKLQNESWDHGVNDGCTSGIGRCL